MEMNGEHRIAAPKAQVWAALNDPEVLKGAIPGCEELIMASPTEMTAKVRAKVGPVSARFAGKVTISDVDAPNGYRITGEGSGGVAGFAKGGAKVALTEDGDATIMRYEVSAQVGGKLAQIGSRLIDGTAKQMANEFFTKFSAAAEAYVPSGDAAPAVATTPAVEPSATAAPAMPESEPATSEVADDEIVAAPAPVTTFTPRPAPAAPVSPPAPAAVDPLQAEAPDGAAVPAPKPTPAAVPPSRPAADSSPAAAPVKPAAGMSPIVWVTGIIIVAGIILYFATR